MGYLKNMSDTIETDFNYYEEMEWRVVHLHCLEGKFIMPIDKNLGTYRLKFTPDDVKLIVFPDSETKEMALRDAFFVDYFKQFQPILATINDCVNF
jgi:hypothetical protein